MLGQPYYMGIPEVVGFKLVGELPEGATPPTSCSPSTQMLRQEGRRRTSLSSFTDRASAQLGLADRATLANMAPEYGATMGFFPVDDETLNYLRNTGRDEELIDLVERYTKEQGLFRTDETPDPEYTDTLELDMGDRPAEPCRPTPSARPGAPARHASLHSKNALAEDFGRSRRPASADDPPTARWSSRRSPAAPIPPTRRSWSAPAFWPRKPSSGVLVKPT